MAFIAKIYLLNRITSSKRTKSHQFFFLLFFNWNCCDFSLISFAFVCGFSIIFIFLIVFYVGWKPKFIKIKSEYSGSLLGSNKRYFYINRNVTQVHLYLLFAIKLNCNTYWYERSICADIVKQSKEEKNVYIKSCA